IAHGACRVCTTTKELSLAPGQFDQNRSNDPVLRGLLCLLSPYPHLFEADDLDVTAACYVHMSPSTSRRPQTSLRRPTERQTNQAATKHRANRLQTTERGRLWCLPYTIIMARLSYYLFTHRNNHPLHTAYVQHRWRRCHPIRSQVPSYFTPTTAR
ncbi:unnamed protein product, partial [Ectocarpus sp. 12 AP-2014]